MVADRSSTAPYQASTVACMKLTSAMYLRTLSPVHTLLVMRAVARLVYFRKLQLAPSNTHRAPRIPTNNIGAIHTGALCLQNHGIMSSQSKGLQRSSMQSNQNTGRTHVRTIWMNIDQTNMTLRPCPVFQRVAAFLHLVSAHN